MSTGQIIAVITIIAWAFGKDIRKRLKSYYDNLAPYRKTIRNWWKELNPKTKKTFFVTIVIIGVVALVIWGSIALVKAIGLLNLVAGVLFCIVVIWLCALSFCDD